MKLSEYRLIFISISLTGILLIASSALIESIDFPREEAFSEIFLLGPEKMAQDIPFDIVSGQKYNVYLGVGNHMETTMHYVCAVKLRNQTEPYPDRDNQTASPLPTLYEYRSVIQKGENWTQPLTFSISTSSPAKNVKVLQSITINDIEFKVDKIAQYDPENDGYYYQLFIELWAYSSTAEETQYQNRWVYFWFNAT